jgi:hypothetical protein
MVSASSTVGQAYFQFPASPSGKGDAVCRNRSPLYISNLVRWQGQLCRSGFGRSDRNELRHRMFCVVSLGPGPSCFALSVWGPAQVVLRCQFGARPKLFCVVSLGPGPSCFALSVWGPAQTVPAESGEFRPRRWQRGLRQQNGRVSQRHKESTFAADRPRGRRELPVANRTPIVSEGR